MRLPDSHRLWRTRALLGLLLALAPSANAQTPPNCSPGWIRSFGGYPFAGLPDGTVNALVEHDDGHGRALFAGGHFASSSNDPNFIAKWDGWGWTHVGPDFDGATTIRALCVFDDGGGPALYAGGDFTTLGGVPVNHVAKWNGASWSTLGGGTSASVNALFVFDDGGGPALYVGGTFTSAGGVSANRIAKWSGGAWSALGAGVFGPVFSLGAYDDGSGPSLYVGGGFTTAGSVPAHCVARWDGTNWFALGSGTTAQVKSFAVFDDGTGSVLYAGGPFDHAGGVPADHIARWNGTSWSALPVGTSASVDSLLVYDDGAGPSLFAAGTFSSIAGQQVNHIARWDGTNWTALGTGIEGTNPGVNALCAFDDGHGRRLCAAGHFATAGSAASINHAAWDGQGWGQIGSGLDGIVRCAAMYDDGTGPALFVGGEFRHAGSTDARCIAKWDGEHWSALPWMYFLSVTSMAVYDDGSGPALFVGNMYSGLGLARWNGSSWWLPAGGTIGGVMALLVFDDGSGQALYSAAGSDGTNIVSIAKWNGFNWTPLGSGMNGPIFTLAAFDDGSGPALHAGGYFTTADGTTVNGIARWNGTTWLPLGTGMGGSNVAVYSLAEFDDGAGRALYAAGPFTSAGGVPASCLAKWDGSNWHSVGGGLASAQPSVYGWKLASFDDGTGRGLFVTGAFSMAGSTPTRGFARWDGASWTDLAFSNHAPASLTVLDDGSPGGEALLVGGYFTSSPAGDASLAKWDLPVGCMPLGTSFCSPGHAGVIACPCGNPPAGTRRGCDNSAVTGGAQLLATGLASLSNDLVQLTTLGETPSATSIVLQGTSASASGLVFGQGVRCVAGSLNRLYLKNAVLGSIQVPDSSDARVSARSAALGDTIVAGSHRYYGVYYRDPNVLGGCAATSTFNITQQVDLLWSP